MSWLCTLTRAIAAAVTCAAVLAAGSGAAHAQNLESAIMPGKVTRAHVKQESDCRQCHVPFDRGAQPRLCLDCHKPVARDVQGKTGFHGRLEQRECRSCHTEHKGRDADIVKLNAKTFDHSKTDFALKGKHRDAKCATCHKTSTRHAEAPSACVECHRKDDKHKETLGTKCESCHTESGWKPSTFDHAKTRFVLLQKHEKAKCSACHTDLQHLANTSRECVSCHRKDDKHKGTEGNTCENCHTESNWKESNFDHSKTRFTLTQRHARVKCTACHDDAQHFANTPSRCVACHRKDDVHKAGLGESCDNCHTAATWKEAARFDHDRSTRFALRDAHRKAKCESCHVDARGRDTKSSGARPFADKPALACASCHERDDREKGHRGRFGDKCETCHTEAAFKTVKFDHGRDTQWVLRGKHRDAKCDSCHKADYKGSLYQEKLVTRCFACHERDDAHKGQLGSDCANCHSESTWRESPFNHDKARFQLRDKHAKVECKSCHATAMFKDAKAECASCHVKDDVHKTRLGTQCEQCHTERDWKSGRFDHDRTKFKLTLSHAKTKCLMCHKEPMKDKVLQSVECVSCHRRDDIHFETNGTDCDRCHTADNWRRVIPESARRKPR